MTMAAHLAETAARMSPRGVGRSPMRAWDRIIPKASDRGTAPHITAYFAIFVIFDPSSVRLYIRPCWPTTNPTIG